MLVIVMGLTKVTRNYQITLPKDARTAFDIRVGDSLFVILKEDAFMIKKSSRNPVDASFGIWNDVDSVKFVRDIRRESEIKRTKKLGI